MTEEFYLKGLALARTREGLGGITAVDSEMFHQSIMGLINLGWTEPMLLDHMRVICGHLESGNPSRD